MRPTPMRLLALMSVLLSGACMSAEKRVDQGIRLEQSGRPAEAARRYADALRRDPSLGEVRVRLQETGDRAIEESLAEAAAARHPAEAADAFVEADELRRVAGAVGVALRVPADYDARRRAAFDRAIDASVAAAEGLDLRADFDAALTRLSRAGTRWEPSDVQRAALSRARFDVQLAGARAALQAGHYRTAHQRAQQAIDLAGPGSPQAPRAMDVQAEAIRLGTLRVAVLPAAAVSDVRGRLPEGLLAGLNDELEGRWRRPPLFVAVSDPREVAREARRRGFLRQVPTRTEARSLADALRAELAAMLVIDSVEVRETDVQETRVAVRTRAGADTAYTLRSGRQQVRVRLAYNLYDVDGYQQPERGTVWGDGSLRFRRGIYHGDPATLVLPPTDRGIFGAEEVRLGPQQVRELAEELAERLERELYATLERRIR